MSTQTAPKQSRLSTLVDSGKNGLVIGTERNYLLMEVSSGNETTKILRFGDVDSPHSDILTALRAETSQMTGVSISILGGGKIKRVLKIYKPSHFR